jgi:hypothetical protein
MLLELRLHPDSRSPAVARIVVDAIRPQPGHLVLRYAVSGTIANLRMPPATKPARSNDLWRHTCFEAFVLTPSMAAYYEFNLAPSGQWAAYRFSGYRTEMSVANEVSGPRVDVQSSADRYEIHASLELARLSDLPSDGVWRLGLAAVIEDNSGSLSYWALAHPPGPPDFHHSDCFAYDLSGTAP